MAGRLSFSSTWVAGRMGKALLQPLFERSAHKGANAPHKVEGGLEMSLEFFASVFDIRPEPPPRQISLFGGPRKPVLLWTDAMWEPKQSVRAGVAFVARFPEGRLGSEVVWLYGAADTPQEILDKFGVKKNYIGQLELLAAALAYFSLPELRHESVFHWIDNTSVLAALIKGYARAHASVRLLHAFKAFAFGLRVDSWFQWVPL